jgi:hypothetical protein
MNDSPKIVGILQHLRQKSMLSAYGHFAASDCYRHLELWHGGAIVGTRVKNDGFNGSLSCWVIRYQLSGDVHKNWIITECKDIYRKVNKAKYGFNMFGGVFDMGLPADEIKPLADKVRSLMQKTHPDKDVGFENEFMQLKAALDLIKTGIPEPTTTHTAGDIPNPIKLLS